LALTEHKMHAQFRDINQRLWIMGDYAEVQFKAYCEREGIVPLPFGFNRPPFEYFPQIPSTLRAMPDFFCESIKNRLIGTLPTLDENKRMPNRHFFCEVKGCGKDNTFKLKDETLAALAEWQAFAGRPVMFFLYDQPRNRTAWLSLDLLTIFAPSLERGYFVDRGKEKPFSRLPVSHRELEWEDACEPAGSSTLTSASSPH
jgi:hypothetical protein